MTDAPMSLFHPIFFKMRIAEGNAGDIPLEGGRRDVL
jgi:hypothetical protein